MARLRAVRSTHGFQRPDKLLEGEAALGVMLGGNSNKISAAGAEGTSLGRRVCIPLTLAFIGAGAILATTWTGGEPGEVGATIAHELVLAIGVLATMNISGGHVDPAVTAVMVVT